MEVSDATSAMNSLYVRCSNSNAKAMAISGTAIAFSQQSCSGVANLAWHSAMAQKLTVKRLA